MRRPAAIVLVLSLSAPSLAVADSSIYRCVMNGVATYSDRHCGADSTAYTPDTDRVSTYAAPPLPKAPARTTSKPRPRAARSSIADEQRKHAEECRRIEEGLREVRSRQRAGYSAKEGERLKARLAKLSARRKSQKC